MSEIRRRRKDNFSERIPLNVLKRETMASQLIKNWRSKIFLLLSILFSVFLYIYVRNSLFIPTNILQKSELPRSEIEDIYKETSWGTLRPHLYFGLKTKQILSPLFGLLWYEQPRQQFIQNLPLRHWCDHGDPVKYGWEAHDGRSFGRQKITDGDLLSFFIDWISKGEKSWTVRMFGRAEQNSSFSFLLYLALQKNISNNGEIEDGVLTPLNLLEDGGLTYKFINGHSRSIGQFDIKILFTNPMTTEKFSNVAYKLPAYLGMVHIKDVILGSFARPENQLDLILHQNERIASFESSSGNVDFSVVQITVSGDFDFIVELNAANDRILNEHFRTVFDKKVKEFGDRFDDAFLIDLKNEEGLEPNKNDVSDRNYRKLAKRALANLLGGIGVWHGYSLVKTSENPNEDARYYGPLSLFSAVPSRPFFPRGFLWDEGFHNLLIRKFDPLLTLQIIASWLDTMNVDGWIPRELVLDDEARARIPSEFLVQSPEVANPPMFFFLLDKFLRNSELFKYHQKRIDALYPRLKRWYIWLRDSQRGPKFGTMQWQGRNRTTNLEVNPMTLPSGLDDFPRASNPSREEYHLDLRCWMALSSKILRQLAEMFDDSDWVPIVEEDIKEFGDITTLDKLHWNEKRQQYSDFGLHSYKFKMVPVKINDQEIQLQRKIIEEPHLRFVDDVFGYVNLFPLLLKLLPSDSPKLGIVLNSLNRTEDLWTNFGLRSLSKKSSYYMVKNTEHNKPYWRAPIWINMNYLTLDALNHYSKSDGQYAHLANELYFQLRSNLVQNIANQYSKTGFFWENYNDTNEYKTYHCVYDVVFLLI
uniref:Mannosyl-oligosaccharide glucosidase n=1 Tax=Meloidogyne enterolobii TaxID=390850 RepID=A0A6V7XEG2_MELEN|nr:unnamed protein product [Meloidogyne enterolobii]